MIKVGDLVCVTKSTSCCKRTDGIGTHFIVQGKVNISGHCSYCKEVYNAVALIPDLAMYGGYDINRCIKIDPPALQDETTTEKELAL